MYLPLSIDVRDRDHLGEVDNCNSSNISDHNIELVKITMNKTVASQLNYKPH